VTVKQLSQLRHQGTVAEIAKVKFPFPSDEFPNYETIVNVPTAHLSVGEADGRELVPDIVVVHKPGLFLRMMVEVEMPDTVTDESATRDWLPMSKVGRLYLYVPAGMVAETKSLLKKHRISVAGIRTWRFRPVWGLEVVEV
jgi:hypothetical protein